MALRVKIRQPTIALFWEEGRDVAHTIPAGSLITAEKVEGEGLIEVQWREKAVRMFAQDIRAPGELIEEDSSST